MSLLTSLSLGLLVTSSLLCTQIQTAAKQTVGRDHVLLITIDDLNDWIGCLADSESTPADGHVTGEGHPQAHTPHMDRLSRRGVLFTQKDSREDLAAMVKKLSAWIPKKEPRGPDLVDDRVKP